MKKQLIIGILIAIFLVMTVIASHIQDGVEQQLVLVGAPQSWSMAQSCSQSGTKWYTHKLLDPDNIVRQTGSKLTTQNFWNFMVKFTPDKEGIWLIKGEVKYKVGTKWIACGVPRYNGGYVPLCGDGDVQGHEECDDGNIVNGDGCSSICHQE